MKKFIYVLVVILCFNTISFANFNDTDNHWAKHYITRFATNEYINGYEDNSFKPDYNIKYNEFIKILVKVMNPNILENSSIWDKPYIEYAKQTHLISNENRIFDTYITRKEVVDIVYNFLKYYDVIYNYNISKEQFLIANDILHGYTDATLRLENNITRAEALTLIIRAIDYRDKCIYTNQCTSDIFKQKDITSYTNYQGKNDVFLNTYKVKNEKIYYSDLGRFGNYTDILNEKYNDIIFNILLALIGKEQYVLNTYFSDMDSICICYGSKDIYVDNGYSLFEIYLLNNSKTYNDFEYNIKIDIHKLWKELYEVKNGIYYNEYYIKKLENVLNIIIDKGNVEQILEFLQNNLDFISSKEFMFIRNGSNITIYIKN